jgi:hypothetical protein
MRRRYETNEEQDMSTSIVQSPRLTARRGKAERWLARAATIVGGTLSYSALGLSSAQYYRVSSATLGPGAVLLTIPKHVEGALAPFVGMAGALGAACGLSALWMERGSEPRAASRPGLGAPLVALAGLAATAMSAVYTKQVLASRGDFAADAHESCSILDDLDAAGARRNDARHLFLVLGAALWVVVAALAVANHGHLSRQPPLRTRVA